MSIHISGVVLQVIICDPAARRLEPVALRVYFVSPFLCSLHIKRVFVRHAFSVLVQHKFPILGFTKKVMCRVVRPFVRYIPIFTVWLSVFLVVFGRSKKSFSAHTKSHFPGRTENHFPGRTKKHFPGRTKKHFPGRTENSFLVPPAVLKVRMNGHIFNLSFHEALADWSSLLVCGD